MNENIKGWHAGLFGKQIQQSAIGGIISDIKKLSATTIVDRFEPTTKVCPICGTIKDISLNDRIYECDCGYVNDRDVHSANNILMFSYLKNNIPMEHRNFKPVEILTSVVASISNCKLASVKQEAQSFMFG